MRNAGQDSSPDPAGPVTANAPSGSNVYITGIRTVDARFPLPKSVAAKPAPTNPVYSYGVTVLQTDRGYAGVGLALTRGGGNRQLCDLIEELGKRLAGRDIEELMSNFGKEFRSIAQDPQYRWLGPDKGLTRLALASITNACFDLWAKSRDVPLWRLLLDLSPRELVSTLDLSYVDDVLTTEDAIALLAASEPGRDDRSRILDTGYPACDTSAGRMAFSDDDMAKKAKAAVAGGFGAIQLKVGSADTKRDVKRANLLRSKVGGSVRILLDADQAWNVSDAIAASQALANIDPYWLAEPTHPDDILGHALIAREIAPMRLAAGAHTPNRVVAKQLLEIDAVHFLRADAVRLGGISEFVTVSLLAKKLGKIVAPHAGDMGQIHQHLVLFNHIALEHEVTVLEHAPYLRDRFARPAIVEDGIYWTPEEPGSSSDLILD